jgi:hypothetical protein
MSAWRRSGKRSWAGGWKLTLEEIHERRMGLGFKVLQEPRCFGGQGGISLHGVFELAEGLLFGGRIELEALQEGGIAEALVSGGVQESIKQVRERDAASFGCIAYIEQEMGSDL